MKRILLLTLLVVAMLVSFSPPVASHAQDPAPDPSTLPLLPQERHLGSMFYGWGAPPPDVIQPRIEEATAAGMNAYTLYLDWPTLEPAPGQYELNALRETLEWAQNNGLSTFANITVVDIEDLVLPPEYLANGESTGNAFSEGYSFTNVDLVGRFFGLLDAVVPLMVEHGVFYLGVGNEVDGWLTENPDQLGDYLAFIAATREHVRSLEPALAVGLTVTGNVPLYDPLMLDTFYQVADVVSANIYAIDVSDFTLTDTQSTIALLEDFLDAYGERPIVIPEIGCNSAASMNSSLELQRECFETVFNVLARYPTVRFATVFTFHDFEPEICTAIQAAFGYDARAGFDSIYDERIADYLCTLGMVNADGSPKAAFEAFLDALPRITMG